MAGRQRRFLGHDLGPVRHVSTRRDCVEDAGLGGRGAYTIHTTLLPARARPGWVPGTRLPGVDYAYLARRLPSARQEEAAFGLSVALLALGAAFAHDDACLADALQR